MGKRKEEAVEEKASRTSVWGEGETPNKSTLNKLAKDFKSSDNRQTMAALGRFAVENDLSAEALGTLASIVLDKEMDSDEAARARRSALRSINGGAKVKRKPKAESEEVDDEVEAVKPAKGTKKGKKKKAA